MFSECHCHLRSPSENATQQTIREAEKRGVELVLDAGIDIASSELAIQNASTYPIVKACVGIHPWNSDQYSGETLDSLRTLASKAHVVAISEIGLDYVGRRDRTGTYVNDYADKSIQQNSFRGQLRLAKELQLPVVVHDRTSTQEVLDILHEEGNAETGAVIHGFSKDYAYARRCMDMDIYLSVGLRQIVATGNEILREAVKQIPLTWLLTETDTSDPGGVLTVAERVAELKRTSVDEVGRVTTQNLRRIIRKRQQ